jgi:hypothetical protein
MAAVGTEQMKGDIRHPARCGRMTVFYIYLRRTSRTAVGRLALIASKFATIRRRHRPTGARREVGRVARRQRV